MGKKITYEEVKEYMDNEGYELISQEYIDAKKKLKIKCTQGHIFEMSWNSFNTGRRCPRCYDLKRKLSRTKKWTKEKAIELFNKHDLLILDMNEFKDSSKTMVCLNKDGYKVLASVQNLLKNRIPHIFQKNPYAYDNFKLLCCKNKLILLEKEWKGSMNNYLVQTEDGYLTYARGDILYGRPLIKFFTTENPHTLDNIKNYCKLNRPNYELISNKYCGDQELLLWKYTGNECENISEEQRYFKMSLHAFKDQNQRFPLLSISLGEQKIKSFLDKNNIKYNMEHIFRDCKNKRVLPFDFYIYDYNITIEYQGIQHHSPIEFFGGHDALEYVKLNDSIKLNYCKNNNINLILLNYWDFDRIEEILSKELNIKQKVSA